MADLTTATRAPVLVDNQGIGSDYDVTSDDPAVGVDIPPGKSVWYATGDAAGTADVTVSKDGRQGMVTIEVTEAPLAVTLGAPEPKG